MDAVQSGRRLRLLVCAAGAAVLILPTVLAAQQTPIFRSRVQGVLVDALVTRNGQPVAGLTAADFEVRDNGVLQTIDLLNPSDVPVNAVLALDMSASTAGRRLQDVKAASGALLDGLRPIDRAALTTFNHAVSPKVPLTRDLSAVRKSLEAASPYGETSILDGIYVALMSTLAETGRSLLVVCTDGRDTMSWLEPDELLDAAKRSNAVTYVVATGGARRWSLLKDLADTTGGRVIDIESSDRLRAEFQRILEDFRSRYVLTFTPTGVSDGGYHRLDVRVKRGGMTVNARPGYLGGPTAPERGGRP